MVQNAFVGVDLFLHDNLAHDGGEGNGELVRLVPAKRIRQITLCVRVNEQYLLTLPRKPDTEIDGCCRFSHATFLVGEGDYFGHFFILLICYCYAIFQTLQNHLYAFAIFVRCANNTCWLKNQLGTFAVYDNDF